MIHQSNVKRIAINVSGEYFETFEKTLSRYPNTLLGDVTKRQKYYCTKTNQLFFNRNRICFGAILYFYQSYGRLSKPLECELNVFLDECEFFEIPNDKISEMKQKEGYLDFTPQYKVNRCSSKFAHKVWCFLEIPESSDSAKYFAIFCLLMITISIAVSCLETIPNLFSDEPEINDFWTMSEFTLNFWFLIELVLRFIFCPHKRVFLWSTLNWVDAVAIIPYFALLCFTNSNTQTLGFLRVLRFSRVVRLLRISKHSKRLQVVVSIIKNSAQDFQILVLCIFLLVVLGGSLLYYAEETDEKTQMTTILHAFWWALQTLTTLGYGDLVPITTSGKLIASAYMAFGAMTMALSMLSIVTKFMFLYVVNLRENAMQDNFFMPNRGRLL